MYCLLHSFLQLNNIVLHRSMIICLSGYSLMNIWAVSLLAIVNVAMNICLHALCSMFVFSYLGYIYKSGNQAYVYNSISHFWGAARLFLMERAGTTLQSHQQCMRVSNFSTFSPVLVISPPFCFCFCFHLFIWLQPFWCIWNDTPSQSHKTEITCSRKPEMSQSSGII